MHGRGILFLVVPAYAVGRAIGMIFGVVGANIGFDGCLKRVS